MGLVRRSPLSAKELEARRANARKSTGPRTPEGKARVSLNRLQHGGRSAWLEVFLRQCGACPRKFFALCESNRLPGERVDPIQAAIVEAWLDSPLEGGLLDGAKGSVAVVGNDPRRQGQVNRATVGSLLSAKKMASVVKALTPDYSQIVTAMVFGDALRTLGGLQAGRIGSQQPDAVGQRTEVPKGAAAATSLSPGLRGEEPAPSTNERTFKASMSPRINEIRFPNRVSPSPRRALGLPSPTPGRMTKFDRRHR